MIRRKTLASLLAVGALGAGVLVGCGDDDTSADAQGGGGGGLTELKIGVLVPLTGDLADFGGPGSKAADLARDQFNAAAKAGGSGASVTLVTEDTKTDPQAAQEAATKLIESDSVAALAGPWGSPEIIPTAENVSVDAGVPLVTPSGTGPQITTLDDDGLVFRTAPSDALQGGVLAQVVAKEFGQDAKVVTANRNDAYGTALVEEFTKAWEAAGGTVVRNVPYNPEAPSLNSEASQIVQGAPDAWVIIDYPDTWKKMGPALVRTGEWDPTRTFTADGLRSGDLPTSTGKESTEGMRGTFPTSEGAPAGEVFDALWKQEVGQPRQTYDAQNFDAVTLIALAAARAGSDDPREIADAMAEVSGPPGKKFTFEQLQQAITAAEAGEDIDYEGASGPIDLDDNGDPGSSNYGTWEYKGGKLVDGTDVIAVTDKQ